MSWFSFNVGDLAKNALNEAQKKIDKALDIEAKHEEKEPTPSTILSRQTSKQGNKSQDELKGPKRVQPTSKKGSTPSLKAKKVDRKGADDFFSAWDDENFNSKKDSKPKSIPSRSPSATSVPDLSNKSQKTPQSEDEISKLVLSDSDIEVISPGTYLSDESAPRDKQDYSNEFVDVPLSVSEVAVHDPIDTTSSLTTQSDCDSSIHDNQPSGISGESSVLTDKEDVFPSPSVPHSEPDQSISSVEAPCVDEPSVSLCSDETVGMEDQPCVTNVVPLSPEDTELTIEDSGEGDDVSECVDANAPSVGEDEQDVSDNIVTSSTIPTGNVNTAFIQEVSTGRANNVVNDDQKYLALSEKTEVYEQQLITLSQRNASLNEENDNLRSEVSRAREQCQKEMEKQLSDAMESVKSYETTCQILKEEKANLVKQFNVLKSQLASRMTHEQVQSAIAEKEESIKGLMEEGEVLAKKHLQQNNLIKKLKAQSQERESELKTLREKASHYEAENTGLKEELKIAKGQGKEERETSLRISDAYEQRERETQLMQEKLALSEEKQRTLQVNLDGAYKEIGDLHKRLAEQESKLASEWEVRESEIRRENELAKKKIMSDQEHQRQLLMMQIVELSNSISRSEANAARKDDDHRREIRELQQRIQESEGRNQDLSDNVTGVTRPLLRQIENLQSTHATQQRSWNALEKTLNYRLGEAQTELLAARESERVSQNAALEAKSKAQALERQAESSRNTIRNNELETDTLKKSLEERKAEVERLTRELMESQAAHKEATHKARKERLFLENQLQMEKVRSEAERKKHTAHQESQQREREKLAWSRSEITSVSSNHVAETESLSSSGEAFQGTDKLERQSSTSSLPGLAHQLSFQSGQAVSMSNVLENLQTQVKLKEGEIAQLRGEIHTLERTRSSMAEEIVRLTNLNEDMEGVSDELRETQVKLADVEGRYTAILTMYGEKQEENEELKMDLADVKAMYRQQINDLLKADVS